MSEISISTTRRAYAEAVFLLNRTGYINILFVCLFADKLVLVCACARARARARARACTSPRFTRAFSCAYAYACTVHVYRPLTTICGEHLQEILLTERPTRHLQLL